MSPLSALVFTLLAASATPAAKSAPAAKPAAAAKPAPAAPAALSQGAASPIVQKLQARYDATQKLKASVVQEMEISGFGRKLTSKGTVYFKRPGRMRWDMQNGQKQTIIADGTHLWIYQPSEHQVYKAPFGQAFQSATPVSFLTGIGRIADDFAVTLDGEGDGLVFLRMVPRAGEGIGTLRLGIDPKTYDILSAEVRDPIGNVTRLQFSDLQRDAEMEDDLFRFEIPQGAEVVEAPAAGLE